MSRSAYIVSRGGSARRGGMTLEYLFKGSAERGCQFVQVIR